MPKEGPHDEDGYLVRALNDFKYQFRSKGKPHCLANATEIIVKGFVKA